MKKNSLPQQILKLYSYGMDTKDIAKYLGLDNQHVAWVLNQTEEITEDNRIITVKPWAEKFYFEPKEEVETRRKKNEIR